MDVVQRHLDALGGSVEVDSRPGHGTRFTIRMPLTLAIIEGLLVRAGDGTFGLPMAGVIRCLDVQSPQDAEREGVLNLRGQAIPFVRLRSFVLGPSEPVGSEVVILVQRGDQQLGIAVDRLLGKTQIVVKPLGRFFQGIPILSGLTILGDGQVAPILNVAGLLQSAISARPSAAIHEDRLRSAEPDAAGSRPEDDPSRASTLRPNTVHLSFLLGPEEYTIPMDRIFEIVPFEDVTRVPTTPAFVKGLVNLQGLAIPVVDLAERFGSVSQSQDERRSIVVVHTRVGERTVLLGLVVDRLGRVLPVSSGQMIAPPRVESLICVEFLAGVFEHEGHFVLCLDVDRILGVDESQMVAELATAPTREQVETHAERRPYLSVRISNERCALGLDKLHEIRPCGTITRIPGSAPYVLGATNIRGSAIPVLDVGQRWQLCPTKLGAQSCLVIMDVEGAHASTSAALLVESVEGLFKLTPEQIDRTPPFGTRFPAHLVSGMAPLGGDFVPILDAEKALSFAGTPSGEA